MIDIDKAFEMQLIGEATGCGKAPPLATPGRSRMSKQIEETPSRSCQSAMLLRDLNPKLPLFVHKLQYKAFRFLVAGSFLRQERGTGGMFKHLADAIIGLG